jgi:uncharacterized protein YdaU (DUF1376 family)
MTGVRGLTAQEVGVYTMLLCRIYEENGPVERHDLRLATYCGMRLKTLTTTLDKLIELGKIEATEGGLMNDRARSEISKRAHDLKNNSKAGIASAKKRQQKQQNSSTTVQRPFNHTDTDKIDTEANASDAGASEHSIKDQVWARGVRFLVARGVADRKARSVIGLWLKDHSDGEVFDAFIAADKERPVEPVAWITAKLGKPLQRSEVDAAFAQIGERMAAQ